MPIKAPPCPEGFEERGMRIRVYPTPEQEATLRAMQAELRQAWNWMVSRNQQAIDAAIARAEREGLLPPRPERPDYTGLDPKASKAAKREYLAACRERAGKLPKAYVQWFRPRDDAKAAGFKQDYQLLMALRGEHNVCMSKHYQALVKNAQPKRGQGRKRAKRRDEDMPLQVRSGDDPIRLGAYGARRGCEGWYNVGVKFAGVSGRIRGRLDAGLLTQLERAAKIRQGVTLRCEAGQWFASIRTWQPARDRTGPQDGSVVGIDPGLADWVALSDGTRIANPRGVAHSDRIAVLQHTREKLADEDPRRDAIARQMTRAHLRQRRHMKQMCYALTKRLASAYDIIAIEKNTGVAVGVGHQHTAATYMLTQVLKDRVGGRLREVEPYYNSQDCSQCGHRSKDSWSRVDGEGRTRTTCACPACGYTENRDVNAARNVARKASETLKARAA